MTVWFFGELVCLIGFGFGHLFACKDKDISRKGQNNVFVFVVSGIFCIFAVAKYQSFLNP